MDREDDAAAEPTEIMPAFVPPDGVVHVVSASAKGAVLVVDGESASTARAVLGRAGFVVVGTDDAVTAAQHLATSSFDAVVSDINPKSMTGIELLRYARENDPSLPVLLMTGAPDVETAAQAIEHGAFQYLLHPVSAERLVGAVERAVAERRMARVKDDALRMMEDLDTVISDEGPSMAGFQRALEQVWMAYQPIVAPDGSLFAHEALVRSVEPGFETADVLLGTAERLGALRELGRKVRQSVGRVAGAVSNHGSVFVNLHPEDLLDELLTSGEDPLAPFAASIVLEITERAALHDVREVKAKMVDLRSMGYRIALDDLGAGYAGLTSFATLAPEIVKLDMGLVRGVDADPLKQKLVRSMTALSRDMGILVVAEGIETEAERDVLVELGCQLLQGYLFGRPAPL
jgi:EAL domain-containing protein (putative c-di-GMP-specific phosphodiesterase class I)